MINENVSFRTVEYMQQRIEELQKENIVLLSCSTTDVLVKEAYANGKADERANIVGHIRQVAERIKNDRDGIAWGHLQAMAIVIEAGEHLK